MQFAHIDNLSRKRIFIVRVAETRVLIRNYVQLSPDGTYIFLRAEMPERHEIRSRPNR